MPFQGRLLSFYPPESLVPISKMLIYLYKVPTHMWGGPGEQGGFLGKWVPSHSQMKYNHNFCLISFQLQLCLVYTIKRHFHWKKWALPPFHTSWTRECCFSLSTSHRKTLFLSAETLVPARLMAGGSRGWS